MIAKRIARNKGTSSPARLVKYMVAAQGSLDPNSWARTSEYILETHGNTDKGERVYSYRVTNCGTDDPAAATILIEATQLANTRSKSDKTYHLVYSFPPGEKPSLETLHAIEDALCASIGYTDHQRVSAVHTDTDHLHVHVAINKVHPTGLQNIEPYFDKNKLMDVCVELENKFDLQRTNHGNVKQGDKVTNQALDIEAQSGVESLIGYVTKNLAPALVQATSWQEVHSLVSEHGLTFKPRGAGFVIGNEQSSLWAKASSCGQGLSFKNMTARLGNFESDIHQAPEKKKNYQPRPRNSSISSANLYAQFQKEKQQATAQKKSKALQLKAESLAFHSNLNAWASTQRMIIKTTGHGTSRRVLLASIRQQVEISRAQHKKSMAIKRQESYARSSTPNWQDWLRHKAENGDLDALTVLRERERTQNQWRGNLLTAEHTDQAKAFVMKDLKPQSRKDGSLSYRTIDGGMVIDKNDTCPCD